MYKAEVQFEDSSDQVIEGLMEKYKRESLKDLILLGLATLLYLKNKESEGLEVSLLLKEKTDDK